MKVIFPIRSDSGGGFVFFVRGMGRAGKKQFDTLPLQRSHAALHGGSKPYRFGLAAGGRRLPNARPGNLNPEARPAEG
jgi:hypothetical protein